MQKCLNNPQVKGIGVWYSLQPLRQLIKNVLNKNILKLVIKRKLIKKKSYGKKYFEHQELNLPYPLVMGYSDIFVVDASTIKRFAHYCGAFAATGLWVEIAIPTAMALTAKKITYNTDIHLKGNALWSSEEIQNLKTKYNSQLQSLLHDTSYWSKYLYLHPVKLSQWDTKM